MQEQVDVLNVPLQVGISSLLRSILCYLCKNAFSFVVFLRPRKEKTAAANNLRGKVRGTRSPHLRGFEEDRDFVTISI